MNTIEEHLEKARNNLAFLTSLEPTRDSFADWAIVVLFYQALHLVSALIHARSGEHGTSHPARFRALQPLLSSGSFTQYERLYNRSRLLRYDQLSATSAEYQALSQRSFQPLLRELQQIEPRVFS